MAMAMKIFFTMITITMALTLALTTTYLGKNNENNSNFNTMAGSRFISKDEDGKVMVAPKRVSRFLAEKNNNGNPRAADHCKKDNEICLLEGKNSTCCNNKCLDLSMDSKNCGACGNKCKYTDTCCGGQCVNLAYDKRHCGACGNKCLHYCFYGMCNYA